MQQSDNGISCEIGSAAISDASSDRSIRENASAHHSRFQLDCPSPSMFDAHCHLDFLEDPSLAVELVAWPCLSMSVTPQAFVEMKTLFSGFPHVHAAVGLHPWWVPADNECALRQANMVVEMVASHLFVGEIGLDFSKRHEHTRLAQMTAFEHIVKACADAEEKVLSIHALCSADAVLDALERHRATKTCTCILHWFSGSNDQLRRAIELGCLFSINDRMISSGRGREYAKIIPDKSMLLESDLPSSQDDPCSIDDIKASLQATLAGIEEIKHRPMEETIARNAARLLQLSR